MTKQRQWKPPKQARTSAGTTIGGILAAVGTILTAIAPPAGIPYLVPIGVSLSALGQFITGLKARDNNISDEVAGAHMNHE